MSFLPSRLAGVTTGSAGPDCTAPNDFADLLGPGTLLAADAITPINGLSAAGAHGDSVPLEFSAASWVRTHVFTAVPSQEIHGMPKQAPTRPSDKHGRNNRRLCCELHALPERVLLHHTINRRKLVPAGNSWMTPSADTTRIMPADSCPTSDASGTGGTWPNALHGS
jgi:hypothetical protein